jgi:hypothetical protein
MILTRKNVLFGTIETMEIPISEEDLNKGIELWESGTLIQDAFPNLEEQYREFIMTGITPEQWNSLFASEAYIENVEEDDDSCTRSCAGCKCGR